MAGAVQVARADTVALATAPGQRLLPAAAAAWDTAARACQMLHGWMPTLTDSFRPYEVQERIFKQRYTTAYTQYAKGKVDAREWQGRIWYRRPGYAAAAVPGTSNHGGGVAVDAGRGGQSFLRFDDPYRKAFLAIAKPLGWTDDEGRAVSEPWHLRWSSALQVSKPGSTVPGTHIPIPDLGGSLPDPLEDDMYANDEGLQQRLDQIVDFIAQNFTGLTGTVQGEGDQTRRHVDQRVNDLAGWTRDDANAIRGALASLPRAGSDPKAIAAALAPLIPAGADPKAVADAVADELANRLKG